MWPLSTSNIEAITLPFGVFFRRSVEATHEQTINHEMIHVRQIKSIGIISFYSTYLWDYLTGLLKYRSHDQAYRNIRFEKEAYEKQ